MRILLLSTYDGASGAGRGAYRLHTALRSAGADSRMLVQGKFTDDETVNAPRLSYDPRVYRLVRRWLDTIPTRMRRVSSEQGLSVQWLPEKVAARVKQLNPDIVNLQWVCGGFLRAETVAKLPAPVVWTLRDMWAFTGGCHYTGDCLRYTNQCGRCPALGGRHGRDLSRSIWQRKSKAWQEVNLTVVTVSNWLAERARASSLFSDRRIEVIPNALDLNIYKPVDSRFARSVLNLPADKKLVLFGSLDATSDPRKGFDLLVSSMRRIASGGWNDNVEMVVFGASEPANPPDLGLRARYLGHFNDETSLVLAYSAADVMVVPSIQEAFGQTASESMACGTPVVAFDSTGPKDIVDHQMNGYLARTSDAEDLARGIMWVLEDGQRRCKLGDEARSKAESEYAQSVVAGRYLSLYEELLEQKPGTRQTP